MVIVSVYNSVHLTYHYLIIKISILQSLKQGDRTDRQIEYLNRYCVYDIDIAKIVMRTSIHHRNSREYWLMPVVSICSRAFNSLLERMISGRIPRKWLYTEPSGDKYYNLFFGIRPDIMKREYKEEIGKGF